MGFDFDKFYAEVRRVAAPGAMIAAWMYGLFESDPRTDAIINKYYHETLHGYWDAGRDHIDEGYARIPFPFEPIAPPPLSIKLRWSLAELLGYLATWSAFQTYIAQNGINPLDEVRKEIGKHWPLDEARDISFPLTIKAGRVNTVS